MPTIFDNLKIGNLTLPNRIIMAPLTRMRSKQPGNIPWELNATYYAQRASAGFIISEATQVSQQGQGYPGTPGIHSKEQVQGWKLITDAVHKNGGHIFLQLWHVGRISHSSHQPNNSLPVAPSAIAAKNSGTYTADWKPTPILTPRALEASELPGIIQDYVNAAKNAKESPYGTFNDMSDSNPVELFTYVIDQLNQRQIAFLDMIEPRATSAGGGDAVDTNAPSTTKLFRKKFKGIFISAGGYTTEDAKTAVESNDVDAVAFGRFFIANPDLPKRIKTNVPLNPYNRETFYGGNEKGYTDYPALS